MLKYFSLFLFFLLFSNLALPLEKEKVKLGIDLVIENNFEFFQNKRIGILSNNAGRCSKGTLTVEEFVKSGKCKVNAIFAPEHGFKTWVSAGKSVSNDTLFGINVYSLYGTNRRPLKFQLDNIDMIIVDLQDIGIRSYTYISTIYKMMDACAEWGIPIVILDRPNPLSGMIVDGNVIDSTLFSFVGIIPIPYIHGCTIGELCYMINEEGWLPKDKDSKPRKCNLSVVQMENWKRWMVWEDTEIKWTPTSPNIPSVNSIRGCAMTGIFGELGIFQIGLGPQLPFQFIGKIDILNLEKIAHAMDLPGVKLEPILKGGVSGLKLQFEYDNGFLPYSSGIRLFLKLKELQPSLFDKSKVNKDRKIMFEKVTGSKKLFEAIFNDSDEKEIMDIIHKGLQSFSQIRNKYLLY